MEKISVIIITLNEEKNIDRCLESVKSFDEIVVVDSGSTDRTVDIARKYTGTIFHRRFDNFSSQKNFALSKCRNSWILSLDADEFISSHLMKRLENLKPQGEEGYRIKRNTHIFGRLMKYGGHDKDMPLKLFNKSKGIFVQSVHEYVNIAGKIGLINDPIIHYSSRDINEYMLKLNLYTDLEVKCLLQKKKRISYDKVLFYPIARFIQLYILRKGYLDGIEGFVFYSLSGFYDFIKYFKCWKIIAGIK
jgi:glycosyltransferase involved in cell wall biosynthesis